MIQPNRCLSEELQNTHGFVSYIPSSCKTTLKSCGGAAATAASVEDAAAEGPDAAAAEEDEEEDDVDGTWERNQQDDAKLHTSDREQAIRPEIGSTLHVQSVLLIIIH